MPALFCCALITACGVSEDYLSGGVWISGYPDEYNIYTMEFRGDSVFIVDDYGFTEVGIYSVKQNRLTVDLELAGSHTFDAKRQITGYRDLREERLELNGMILWRASVDQESWRDYKYILAGIETNYRLDTSAVYASIHLFKRDHAENEVAIGLGDHIADFNEIPSYLEGPHDRNRHPTFEVLLFISDGVELLDLQKTMTIIRSSGFHQISLVLNKPSLTQYSLLPIRNAVSFSEDCNKLKVSPPPPPPPSVYYGQNFSHYVSTFPSIELVEVNSMKDFDSFISNQEGVFEERQALLLITPEMSMEEYVQLNLKLLDLNQQEKKLHVLTTILLP